MQIVYLLLFFLHSLKIFETIDFDFLLVDHLGAKLVRIRGILTIQVMKEFLSFGRLKNLQVPIFHVVFFTLIGLQPSVVFQKQETDYHQGKDYTYQDRLAQVMFVTNLLFHRNGQSLAMFLQLIG